MNNKVMPIALVLVLFISFGSIMREEILDVYKNMDTYYNYKKDCKIVKNYDIKHINLIEDQKVHDIIYKILLANSYIKQGTISNYMYNTKDEYKSEISGYLLKYKNINTKTFYIVNRLIYLNENLGNVNSQLKRSNEYKYLKYFVVSIILIMLLILIIIIHEYRKKNIKNEILNHKVEILNKQLNYQWKHYNDIKKHQDEVKRHWHDIKKHSTLILNLLENEEYQEAKDYIRSVTQEIKEVESKNISKNKIIDAILSNKIEECNSKNINLIMDIKIPETLNINDFDICVIFGNILDNAIEACENIDNSEMEKYIKIKSKLINKQLYIYIENSKDGNIIKKKNKFITSKKDKYNHGLGLKNVKNSIEKYNGKIRINYDEKIFQLSILMKN